MRSFRDERKIPEEPYLLERAGGRPEEEDGVVGGGGRLHRRQAGVAVQQRRPRVDRGHARDLEADLAEVEDVAHRLQKRGDKIN